MQSEELDEPEVSTPANTMTFSDNAEYFSAESKLKSSDDNVPHELKTEFDGINLEDDIERVEESSLDSSETNNDSISSAKLQESDIVPLSGDFTENANESIKSWLQRISEMQNEIQKKLNQSHPVSHMSQRTNTTTSCGSVSNPSRVVKYQDLPYMGEMTLDNSKPRRGRKPKKADICHLIYKNYGTILPGTPNPDSYTEKESTRKVQDKELLQEYSNRSDVQNRIISSLLEKRLTQEYKRTSKLSHTEKKSTNTSEKASNQNEPLNLCIRDLNQLKIRLLKKNDNTYTSEIKSEPQSDDENESVGTSDSPSSRKDQPNFLLPTIDNMLGTSILEPSKDSENGAPPGGYIYWPNAGVFIHPMALQQQLMYYQRLAANNNLTLPSISSKPQNSNSTNSERPSQELRKLAPKAKPKRQESKEEHHGEVSNNEVKSKRNASSSADKTPTKRKRSAIFIPPIPTENNTNPATEVSICKFKFTGGAKPSLQEKKMLSVDSGGNFRYYSGTGDKSMRGYEFFPRETLQQQITNTQGSSTGAFLQASGEKIYPTPPPDFAGPKINADFLLSPDIAAPALAIQTVHSKQKKRKTKKSMQREKLEQTFKEKGFLIQTQQLESAEGATYCKFRQLRKFTRYLFRSWKDYLPGNVRELQEGEKDDNNELPEQDYDNLSRHSSSDFTPPNTA